MAKQAQQPDKTISVSRTVLPQLQYSHPIVVTALHQKEIQQREAHHVLSDLRKTAIMIGLLVLGEVILYMLLLKHVVIIPNVNY